MSTMKSVSASVSSLSVLSDTISEEPGKISRGNPLDRLRRQCDPVKRLGCSRSRRHRRLGLSALAAVMPSAGAGDVMTVPARMDITVQRIALPSSFNAMAVKIWVPSGRSGSAMITRRSNSSSKPWRTKTRFCFRLYEHRYRARRPTRRLLLDQSLRRRPAGWRRKERRRSSWRSCGRRSDRRRTVLRRRLLWWPIRLWW